ncbi:MAG: glycosyltransferase [Firmicutes bacterium]|nr:glycosyltransferase [Bacillota bacterium]
MSGFARELYTIYNYFVVLYFGAINSFYLMLNVVALFSVRRQMLYSTFSHEVFQARYTPPISLLVPAFNEVATIAQSVRGLLLLEYPQYEVIVVNDGSQDDTLQILKNEFSLYAIGKETVDAVPTQPIVEIYKSRAYPSLVVVDKENGGKADSLNAGINISQFPLICAIDADSIVEPDALAKVAWPFLQDPERVVATGGSVRVINDGSIEAGRVIETRVPHKWRVRVQVVEYLRAFLLGRQGLSVLKMLLIISGAFGLFRKDIVIEVGGYRSGCIGEDMELVVRIHHKLRQWKRPYRIEFVPDPVCWTEAPEDLSTLRKQRNRWHRGLMDTLRLHKAMLFNPRYGRIGLITFPYFIFFELFGPIVELTGYITVPLAFAFGYVDLQFFWLFISVAILYGIFLSVSSVLIEEISFHKYERVTDLLILFAASVIENFGYRQLTVLWRTQAFFDYLRGNRSWGEMTRRGFAAGTDTDGKQGPSM